MIVRRRFVGASLAAAAALALAACEGSSKPAAEAAIPERQALTIEAIARYATGFTVGQAVSARTVYVFFDMQCPHCGRLWEAAKPLLGSAKFVWIPVGFLGPASLAQGATILASKDPLSAMDAHKEALLARRGGMSADSDAKAAFGDKVKANSALLKSFDGRSVPLIVAKDPLTGDIIRKEGALDTEALRMLLKL